MIKYIFREDEVRAFKGADKADPQTIGRALERITKEAGGELTPSAVVADAKNNRSPLHRFFEWDDRKAAEHYRLDQARSLIRSVHVEVDTESGMSRAFISISDRGGVSYRTAADVMNSADLQAKILAQAERDLLAFETRYRELTEICALVRQARARVSARRSTAGHDMRVPA